MITNPLPSLADLKEWFVEREPGVLYWRKLLRNSLHSYQREVVAGTISEEGRCRIQFFGTLYYRSRIIWKLHTGADPVNEIDHINRDPSDDRFENLRDVTSLENSRNRFDKYTGPLVKWRPIPMREDAVA